MKKKVLIIVVFLWYCPSFFLYSQNLEKVTYVTYMGIRSDGSPESTRTVTVDAVLSGWIQMEVKVEGNYRAVYQAFKLIGGEWSDWELEQRQPMQGTIQQQYNALRRDYELYPNWGTVWVTSEQVRALRIMSTPEGQTSPVWWSKNGNSFFVFYKLYIIR